MASCGLGGVLNGKSLATYPEFNMNKHGRLQILNGHRCSKQEATHGPSLICFGQKPANFSCFVRQQPWRHPCTFSVINCSRSQITTQPEDVEVKKSIRETNQLISSSQVESLITEICDTTSIAEFKLNLGGFRLNVKRGMDGYDSATLPPTTLPPIHVGSSNGTPNQNGSAASSSLAIVKPESSSSGEIQSAIDANTDGLFMLPSPKVGLFRRCRVIKGKRAPPSCKEKQEVKEGQVLCYVEQLGAQMPIESDVSGEVVKILRYDGEAVGYGDALIAILPSFPGIK